MSTNNPVALQETANGTGCFTVVVLGGVLLLLTSVVLLVVAIL